MALKKRGKYWYGDSQADIRGELVRYGKLDDEVPTQFKDVRCKCGSTTFRLQMDEEQGAAVRTCASCGAEHAIGDSDEYLKDANLEPRGCGCGGDAFEITVGVSLYEGSNDARWLYVGCRCPACGMLGNYGDWTSEFPDYAKLLERI
jgi:hypothetical protein